MLFNSDIFVFCFLPITLIGFYGLNRFAEHYVAKAWLVFASLFFYGWWNPVHLGLILSSVFANYLIGQRLNQHYAQATASKRLLYFGVAFNLALLGYFKYAGFLVDNINALTTANITLHRVVLPLAISFFTFQQVAYLIDARRGRVQESGFLNYILFVTFFPQLIAGPIVHHQEVLPQFLQKVSKGVRSKNFSIGFTIFAIGLFKKIVLADNVGAYATPVFAAAEQGAALTLLESWAGLLAYTCQIYFDFSGYSDMAIGLARLFGIRLPLNFNSPYKARCIVDFWRRWHITLSRFLRDYLYFSLGGGRRGHARRLANLMIVMLLGGLWHGAGWTFVLWGGLHGSFLVANHAWRKWGKFRLPPAISWALTLLVVVLAWVPFRADSLAATQTMFASMAGAHPSSLAEMFSSGIFGFAKIGASWIALCLLIAVVLPNTSQIMRRYRPGLETYKGEIRRLSMRRLEWRPTRPWAVFSALTFLVSVLSMEQVSEFLYFQF